MKRWISRIVLVLALGGALNVYAALLCYVHRSGPCIPIGEATLPAWPRDIPDDWSPSSVYVLSYRRSFGEREHWVRPIGPNASHKCFMGIYQAGWPLPALESWCCIDNRARPNPDAWYGVHELGASLGWLGLPRGSHLPTSPVPIGIAVNTVVYAAFLGLALPASRGTFRAARALIRLRRGLCPACSYSLAGLAPNSPCPECGHTRA